jgi:hypothetical protein
MYTEKKRVFVIVFERKLTVILLPFVKIEKNKNTLATKQREILTIKL